MRRIKLFESTTEGYIPSEVLGYIGDILLDMSDNKQPYTIQYYYGGDWRKPNPAQTDKVLSVIVKFCQNRRNREFVQKEHDEYWGAARNASEHLLNYIESIGYCYNIHVSKLEVKLNREGNKKADSGSEPSKLLKRFETINELIDYAKSSNYNDVEFCFFELPE